MAYIMNPYSYKVGYSLSWSDNWFSNKKLYPIILQLMLTIRSFLFFFWTNKEIEVLDTYLSHINLILNSGRLLITLFLYEAKINKPRKHFWDTYKNIIYTIPYSYSKHNKRTTVESRFGSSLYPNYEFMEHESVFKRADDKKVNKVLTNHFFFNDSISFESQRFFLFFYFLGLDPDTFLLEFYIRYSRRVENFQFQLTNDEDNRYLQYIIPRKRNHASKKKNFVYYHINEFKLLFRLYSFLNQKIFFSWLYDKNKNLNMIRFLRSLFFFGSMPFFGEKYIRYTPRFSTTTQLYNDFSNWDHSNKSKSFLLKRKKYNWLKKFSKYFSFMLLSLLNYNWKFIVSDFFLQYKKKNLKLFLNHFLTQLNSNLLNKNVNKNLSKLNNNFDKFYFSSNKFNFFLLKIYEFFFFFIFYEFFNFFSINKKKFIDLKKILLFINYIKKHNKWKILKRILKRNLKKKNYNFYKKFFKYNFFNSIFNLFITILKIIKLKNISKKKSKNFIFWNISIVKNLLKSSKKKIKKLNYFLFNILKKKKKFLKKKYTIEYILNNDKLLLYIMKKNFLTFKNIKFFKKYLSFIKTDANKKNFIDYMAFMDLKQVLKMDPILYTQMRSLARDFIVSFIRTKKESKYFFKKYYERLFKSNNLWAPQNKDDLKHRVKCLNKIMLYIPNFLVRVKAKKTSKDKLKDFINTLKQENIEKNKNKYTYNYKSNYKSNSKLKMINWSDPAWKRNLTYKNKFYRQYNKDNQYNKNWKNKNQYNKNWKNKNQFWKSHKSFWKKKKNEINFTFMSINIPIYYIFKNFKNKLYKKALNLVKKKLINKYNYNKNFDYLLRKIMLLNSIKRAYFFKKSNIYFFKDIKRGLIHSMKRLLRIYLKEKYKIKNKYKSYFKSFNLWSKPNIFFQFKKGVKKRKKSWALLKKERNLKLFYVKQFKKKKIALLKKVLPQNKVNKYLRFIRGSTKLDTYGANSAKRFPIFYMTEKISYYQILIKKYGFHLNNRTKKVVPSKYLGHFYFYRLFFNVFGSFFYNYPYSNFFWKLVINKSCSRYVFLNNKKNVNLYKSIIKNFSLNNLKIKNKNKVFLLNRFYNNTNVYYKKYWSFMLNYMQSLIYYLKLRQTGYYYFYDNFWDMRKYRYKTIELKKKKINGFWCNIEDYLKIIQKKKKLKQNLTQDMFLWDRFYIDDQALWFLYDYFSRYYIKILRLQGKFKILQILFNRNMQYKNFYHNYKNSLLFKKKLKKTKKDYFLWRMKYWLNFKKKQDVLKLKENFLLTKNFYYPNSKKKFSRLYGRYRKGIFMFVCNNFNLLNKGTYFIENDIKENNKKKNIFVPNKINFNNLLKLKNKKKSLIIQKRKNKYFKQNFNLLLKKNKILKNYDKTFLKKSNTNFQIWKNQKIKKFLNFYNYLKNLNLKKKEKIIYSYLLKNYFLKNKKKKRPNVTAANKYWNYFIFLKRRDENFNLKAYNNYLVTKEKNFDLKRLIRFLRFTFKNFEINGVKKKMITQEINEELQKKVIKDLLKLRKLILYLNRTRAKKDKKKKKIIYFKKILVPRRKSFGMNLWKYLVIKSNIRTLPNRFRLYFKRELYNLRWVKYSYTRLFFIFWFISVHVHRNIEPKALFSNKHYSQEHLYEFGSLFFLYFLKKPFYDVFIYYLKSVLKYWIGISCNFNYIILTNDELSAEFMASHIARALHQGFVWREVVKPVRNDLNKLLSTLRVFEKRSVNKYYDKFNFINHHNLDSQINNYSFVYMKLYIKNYFLEFNFFIKIKKVLLFWERRFSLLNIAYMRILHLKVYNADEKKRRLRIIRILLYNYYYLKGRKWSLNFTHISFDDFKLDFYDEYLWISLINKRLLKLKKLGGYTFECDSYIRFFCGRFSFKMTKYPLFSWHISAINWQNLNLKRKNFLKIHLQLNKKSWYYLQYFKKIILNFYKKFLISLKFDSNGRKRIRHNNYFYKKGKRYLKPNYIPFSEQLKPIVKVNVKNWLFFSLSIMNKLNKYFNVFLKFFKKKKKKKHILFFILKKNKKKKKKKKLVNLNKFKLKKQGIFTKKTAMFFLDFFNSFYKSNYFSYFFFKRFNFNIILNFNKFFFNINFKKKYIFNLHFWDSNLFSYLLKFKNFNKNLNYFLKNFQKKILLNLNFDNKLKKNNKVFFFKYKLNQYLIKKNLPKYWLTSKYLKIFYRYLFFKENFFNFYKLSFDFDVLKVSFFNYLFNKTTFSIFINSFFNIFFFTKKGAFTKCFLFNYYYLDLYIFLSKLKKSYKLNKLLNSYLNFFHFILLKYLKFYYYIIYIRFNLYFLLRNVCNININNIKYILILFHNFFKYYSYNFLNNKYIYYLKVKLNIYLYNLKIYKKEFLNYINFKGLYNNKLFIKPSAWFFKWLYFFTYIIKNKFTNLNYKNNIYFSYFIIIYIFILLNKLNIKLFNLINNLNLYILNLNYKYFNYIKYINLNYFCFKNNKFKYYNFYLYVLKDKIFSYFVFLLNFQYIYIFFFLKFNYYNFFFNYNQYYDGLKFVKITNRQYDSFKNTNFKLINLYELDKLKLNMLKYVKNLRKNLIYSAVNSKKTFIDYFYYTKFLLGYKLRLSGRFVKKRPKRLLMWLRRGLMPLSSHERLIDYGYSINRTVCSTFSVRIWLHKNKNIKYKHYLKF